MKLDKNIDYSINLLRKAEPMALRLDPENGFYLAFSGGKDSQALYHIAQMAGVKFKAHMNLTSVDPPDVIRFVRRQYPDVELIKPKMSIYDMTLKKHLIPTRTKRWCCAKFKETSGAGKVTLTGIRKQESTRRYKRNEFETGKNGKASFSGTFDQWEEHEETILISPIIYWTERDVWKFLNEVVKVPHCSLYDEGSRRIGCILCPMSNYKQKIKDCQRFPHAKHKWIQTIQKLIDGGYINHNFQDAEFGFNWWISGQSFSKFYADEVLQQKIDFDV